MQKVTIMGKTARFLLIVMSVLIHPIAVCSQEKPVAVSAEVADGHLVKKVDPVPPPLAQVAGIGGKVVAELHIQADGTVESVSIVSGHPLLVQAAINALKQRKYKPFLVAGAPSPVWTRVEMLFPSRESEQENKARRDFFPVVDKCDEHIRNKKFSEAEQSCRQAVQISNQMFSGAILERCHARSLLGHALLLQNRVDEAIPLYEEVVRLSEKHRDPDDADLATDYANLAFAYRVADDLDRADPLYAKAVTTFEAAILNLPSMKENYTRRLKNTLLRYAELKRARGDEHAAEALRKKAAQL